MSQIHLALNAAIPMKLGQNLTSKLAENKKHKV